MSKKTHTRADLADSVLQHVGLSYRESAAVVDDFFAEIVQSLVRGENVKLSSFATLAVRHKKPRIGRNPKTGDLVPIEARRVLSFKASAPLRNRVNRAKKKV